MQTISVNIGKVLSTISSNQCRLRPRWAMTSFRADAPVLPPLEQHKREKSRNGGLTFYSAVSVSLQLSN
jgi:hypothetical protein